MNVVKEWFDLLPERWQKYRSEYGHLKPTKLECNVKAITKKVGESPVQFDGELDYEFVSGFVGGYIEMVPIGPGVDVICNEEGMFAGSDGGPLPQNAAGFLGNILIVAVDTDSGEFRSLTDEELRKGFAYLQVFKDVVHPGDSGSGILVGDEAEDFIRAKSCGTMKVWESL